MWGVASAAGFLLLYVVFVVWQPGQWLDSQAFGRVQSLGVGHTGLWLPFIARRVLPVLLFAVVLAAGLRALAARQWRSVFTAVLVVVVPVVLSPMLRDDVLRRPVHEGSHFFPSVNTFPSTHVALVVSLVAALWILLESPPAWFSRIAVLTALIAVSGNVIGHAHRPSDALGSVLLVGAVYGLARGAGRSRSTLGHR